LATDVIDTVIAAGHSDAPASGLKAAELRSERHNARTIWQAWKGSPPHFAERAIIRHGQSRQSPLAGRSPARLREPLTAMLRLHSDWDVRGTDMVAVRMIDNNVKRSM